MKLISSSKYLLFIIICCLVPVSVFGVIWVPVIRHYHVPNIIITDTMVEKARYLPNDSILDELNSNKFRGLGIDYQWDNEEKLIEKAEKILLGIIPGLPYKIGMPFNADDIKKGLPGEQMKLAGFFIPDLLLSAYQVTGREIFLTTARDVILAWALYERQIRLPRGMIWNDYSIAARNETLIKFWAIYRNHRTYQPEVAKTILQLVVRDGEFLAKPSHFTFSSNHGVIQNLALLRLYLAFPTLPKIEQYKQIALHGLHDQMPFYINDEGVVLEHSAHYQEFGVHLVGMLFRYLTLMNEPIPQIWKEKYEKAKDYLSQLRKPDGSLPMYGDTNSWANSLDPPVATVDDNGRSSVLEYRRDWIPKHSNSIYPIAGYSIWWDGLNAWPDEQKLSQTTVIWSYFPGQAHKHADEMSVLLYAGGQTWWTNVGYWTYGVRGRTEAESWSGSNAPHLIDEDTHSIRNTKLLSYGWSDHLNVIDLERTGPREYAARRQVIRVKPNLWLIVDNTSGSRNSRTTTIWTTSSGVKLREGKIPGSYILDSENHASLLTKFIITSGDAKVQQYYGSYSPFAGWEMGKPASAIVVEQKADNSWTAAIWALEDASPNSMRSTSRPLMKEWKGPEAWNITLPTKEGQYSIRREGEYVYTSGGNNIYNNKVRLIKAPDVSGEYLKIREAYEQAAREYPIFKPFLSYRMRMTYLALLFFLVQEVFFLVYGRSKGKYYTHLRVLSILGWIGIAATWVLFLHFKA